MTQTTTPLQVDPQIRRIFLFTSWFGCAIALISYVILKDAAFCQAVLAGLILVLTNFWFITKIVVKLLDQHYTRKAFLGVLFALKLLFVIGFVLVSFQILRLDVIGFVMGYGALVPVAVFSQLFGAKSSSVQKSDQV